MHTHIYIHTYVIKEVQCEALLATLYCFYCYVIKIENKLILSCDVWLDPVFEVKYPCFPTTWIMYKRSRFSWILCKTSRLLVTWLFGINDSITYPLWCFQVDQTTSHDNGCLLWCNGTSNSLCSEIAWDLKFPRLWNVLGPQMSYAINCS